MVTVAPRPDDDWVRRYAVAEFLARATFRDHIKACDSCQTEYANRQQMGCDFGRKALDEVNRAQRFWKLGTA